MSDDARLVDRSHSRQIAAVWGGEAFHKTPDAWMDTGPEVCLYQHRQHGMEGSSHLLTK